LQKHGKGIDGQVIAGDRTAVYDPIVLWLSEAAALIACKLASADPGKYSEQRSPVDDARRQLVRALFDGAVYSEGVRWRGEPGPDDPSEPPSILGPDEWEPIEAGWWSHERYEQYVYRHRQTEFELLLLRPELANAKEGLRPEFIEKIVEGVYLLDRVIVSWNGNSFDIEGFEGDYGYARIRVRRADIEAHFSGKAAERQFTELEPPTGAAPAVEHEPPKRGRRPAHVRSSVYEWLDSQPDGSLMCNRPHTELAHCYCTEVVKPRDELALRKCIDTMRKQVAKWCQDRCSRKP
jgi:hypothetical protein